MRARETCSACSAMDNPTHNSAAPQQPAPGAYPASVKVDSPPSVASTSVQVRDEVNSILTEANFMPGTMSGVPVMVVSKDRWELVQQKLSKALEKQSNSVSVAELSELQRELSMLRLKVNKFDSEEERYQFAESELKKALLVAKQKEEAARVEANSSLAELSTATSALKSSLAAANQMRKDYEKALVEARKTNSAEDVAKLSEDKKRLSAEINSLNNSLQQVNSDRATAVNKLKRFERQSLELTNELNLERSRHSISNPGPGETFAEKARALGTSSVELFNLAHSNLSDLAKKRFSNISEEPLLDEKNTAFWLKATFDATKHSIYKPYKIIFGGLADDFKAMSVKSRKKFGPFLLAVRDSLLPSGKPLSFEEMNKMLESIDTDDIVLNSQYKNLGYRTLTDLVNSGYSLSTPVDSIPHRNKKGKSPVVSEDNTEKLHVVDPQPEPDSDHPLSGDGVNIAPSDDGDDDDDEVSYWLRMRNWFIVKFDSLNHRVRKALSKNPARLRTYFKLSTGNMFQRFCLVPYSWYLWAFP